MTTLHTALDAPSLVFFAPVGTCSLNQSYGYAFGPRIKYGAGSGTHWRKKFCVIIASPGEKSGLTSMVLFAAMLFSQSGTARQRFGGLLRIKN